MKPPTVEAVVVTHRRPKNLLPVLTALRRQSHPLARITVIDAAPSDEFRPTIGFDLADRVMCLGENFGGFNRYVPLLAYRDEFTLFVDDDYMVGPDAVRRMLTVAAAQSDFGVIGEVGRSLSPALEYSYRDIRTGAGDVQPVDLIIRGYLTRTAALPCVAEMLWRLPAEWRPAQIQFDDLVLCVGMQLQGRPCLVYRPDRESERLIDAELPDDFSIYRRRNHTSERTAFLRMARERLGWRPMSERA